MTNATPVPEFMPTLASGRHRNPRKGACFMEMASYLAGERWSDHPRCTHPLLAALARETNDRLGDEARQALVPLIPSVVGLTSEDPRVDAWIAREAALTGLPVVAETRQRALAVGALRCETALAELEGLPADHVSERTRQVLTEVPDAEQWARDFLRDTGRSRTDAFLRRGAPAVVHQAVTGIAQACVPDPGSVLVDLLRRTISGLQRSLDRTAVPTTPRVSRRLPA